LKGLKTRVGCKHRPQNNIPGELFYE